MFVHICCHLLWTHTLLIPMRVHSITKGYCTHHVSHTAAKASHIRPPSCSSHFNIFLSPPHSSSCLRRRVSVYKQKQLTITWLCIENRTLFFWISFIGAKKSFNILNLNVNSNLASKPSSILTKYQGIGAAYFLQIRLRDSPVPWPTGKWLHRHFLVGVSSNRYQILRFFRIIY